MPRTARTVIPGVPHHVTQRGNNKQDVFFVDDDRRAYLEFLKRYSQEEGLKVLGYCLMANHVHLVAIPTKEQSLARTMARTHLRYTQYINRLHGRTGHLWQNRFYSCPLDDRHLWLAMRYVERNPVRAGMVKLAWKYRWSSAGPHINGEDPTGLLALDEWRNRARPELWKAELAKPEKPEELENIRSRTRRGRPLGSDSFVSKLEVLLGRRLRPLPRGRPKKARR